MKQILLTYDLVIERIKSNLESTLYWPSINNDRDEMISNCNET